MPAAAAIRHWITADPRHGQIATLTTLLAWGIWQLAVSYTHLTLPTSDLV